MKLLKYEHGQMLIMTAVELALLLGFLALAADVGTLFHSKRQMQIAADAAATAGAVNELDGGSTYTGLSDQTVADNAAAANGFTAGQNGVVVTINSGSNITDGYHSGPGYVEAIISKPDPLYFFKVFEGQNTATVAARAVAGSPGGAPGCVYLQNQLYLKGSATITTQTGQPACGVYVNSTSSSGNSAAVYNNDGGTTVNTTFLATPGGLGKKQTSPTPTTILSAPVSAPYQNLYQPTPTADCTTGTSGNTLTASSYSGTIPTYTSPDTNLSGISITCFSAANVSISNATFGAGLYIFENGVNLGGTVNVNGGTLDVYSGSFNQGNGALSITAPTSGPFNSIGLMQPASNTNEMQLQFGSSTETLDAYIYAPGAELYIQDQGGNVVATGIVASSLHFNTGTLYLPNYNLVHAATTPNRVVSLVE